MLTFIDPSTDTTIHEWWQQTQTRLKLFFSLMDETQTCLWRINNPEGFIQHLQRIYRQLESEPCPTGAETIRKHLLHAVHYLTESLAKPDRRSFESQVRYDVAKAELSILQEELARLGVLDELRV